MKQKLIMKKLHDNNYLRKLILILIIIYLIIFPLKIGYWNLQKYKLLSNFPYIKNL